MASNIIIHARFTEQGNNLQLLRYSTIYLAEVCSTKANKSVYILAAPFIFRVLVCLQQLIIRKQFKLCKTQPLFLLHKY